MRARIAHFDGIAATVTGQAGGNWPLPDARSRTRAPQPAAFKVTVTALQGAVFRARSLGEATGPKTGVRSASDHLEADSLNAQLLLSGIEHAQVEIPVLETGIVLY
jgi:hypothetical protein